MDEFGRVDKEKARRREEGAGVKVAGKRPSVRSEGTGEKNSGLNNGAGPASRKGQ